MVTANAAREGVRAAAVCEDIEEAVDRTRQGHEAEWCYFRSIPCIIGGQPVAVRVRLDLPTVLPHSGAIWQTWGLPKLQTSAVGIAVCEKQDAIYIAYKKGFWVPIPCLLGGFEFCF